MKGNYITGKPKRLHKNAHLVGKYSRRHFNNLDRVPDVL